MKFRHMKVFITLVCFCPATRAVQAHSFTQLPWKTSDPSEQGILHVHSYSLKSAKRESKENPITQLPQKAVECVCILNFRFGAHSQCGKPNNVYVYHTVVLVPADPLHRYRGLLISVIYLPRFRKSEFYVPSSPAIW